MALENETPTDTNTYMKLSDYQATDYGPDQASLYCDLFEDHALIRNKMRISKKNLTSTKNELYLYGENLQLVVLNVNGKSLMADPVNEFNYKLTTEGLSLSHLPDQFDLEIHTRIEPQNNTSLEGLYKSGSGFCTQNESQGFRKITYYFDRPDVLAKFDICIEAEEARYPVLLANGNLIESGKKKNGRHFAHWADPFPKASYLVAIVAGNYGCLRDEYLTGISNKKILLEIYCEKGNEARCQFAMESLKKSMKWDEVKYGREYDLDRFMILVVNDFNSGAMENKGLNIFNSRLVLADPDTATDGDYDRIESVVAHEYFHNWTGNRVTLRDWFHLSLKEGLTVFRDQQFSADQTSPGVRRIDDVEALRGDQFAEDAGPNAHPVRPETCMSFDNFYTSTIYEKGSEVIRMISVMVGEVGFRKGMDLYFDRHDGQAVIIEDFIKCFEDAHHLDLTQFKLWYSQFGTPIVNVSENYDPSRSTYTLTFLQDGVTCPKTQTLKPFHIPVSMGLLDSEGSKIPGMPELLELKQAQQSFTFTLPAEVKAKPIPSLLQGFSAPIVLKTPFLGPDQLRFLSQHEQEPFRKWESAQGIYLQSLTKWVGNPEVKPTILPSELLFDLTKGFLKNAATDPALFSRLLSLPTAEYLSQFLATYEPLKMSMVFDAVDNEILKQNKNIILSLVEQMENNDPKSLSNENVSKRRLWMVLVNYLSNDLDFAPFLFDRFQKARNMTEQFAALSALNQGAHGFESLRDQALKAFYDRWSTDPLVFNKWLTLQAVQKTPFSKSRFQDLMTKTPFRLQNPNNVYSLLGQFSWGNLVGFHTPGAYEFIAETLIEIDRLNPQVAARVVSCFDSWKKWPEIARAKGALELMLQTKGLSKNTLELVKNSAEN